MNPQNIISYNNKTILRFDYKIQAQSGGFIDTSVYIRVSDGQQINPKSMKLTKDLVQESSLKYVCCTTALETCINSWITNAGGCWITESGASWGLP